MLANDVIPELIFDEPGLRGPRGESGDAPSLNVMKTADNLYSIMYKDWDYSYGVVYADEIASMRTGGSILCNGNIIGHNYDGGYDKRADFVVTTTASKGRHASIGMANVGEFLKSTDIDAGTENEDIESWYKVMPLMLTDGINDAGLACVINSYPNDYGRTTGTNPDGVYIPEFCLVRYVLDNAATVDEAIDVLGDANIYMPSGDEIKSEFYILISDANRAVRVEFINNTVSVTELEIDEKITATNFSLRDYDGTDETLQPHANGVERYNALIAGLESVETEADVMNLLKSVKCTNKYDMEAEPFWYSDYRKDWSEHGWGDITKDSPVSDYTNPIQYSVGQFSQRTRDGATDHTIHTAVYNASLGTLTVVPQEGDVEYHFCLDLMKIVEANAENRYTKSETDMIAEELHTTITEETAELLDEKMNVPDNEGEEGQMLVKTAEGHEWENVPTYLPEVTEEDNDKVMAVENGKWVLTDKFADYIRYTNITVNITSDTGGVCQGGLTITIKNADTGDLVNSQEYKGQPVTFHVPRGLHYIVEQSGVWEGYFNPQPEYIEGVSSNDTTLIFTYEAVKVPSTLRELEIIVDGGGASTLSSHIGLQFDDVYEQDGTEYDIIWDLKDVINVRDENGASHTGVVLEWHTATPISIPFDAPERLEVKQATTPVAEPGMYYYGASGSNYHLIQINAGDRIPYSSYDAVFVNEIRSSDASIVKRGYSRYDESAIRKWLNSDEYNWFTPSHIGDTPPDDYNMYSGFMKGCSEQILRMAKPVMINTNGQTSMYHVYDKFFIPSVTEVYGANSVEEGKAWADWIDATGFASPSNSASTGRKINQTGAISAQQIALRTQNIGYQYIIWCIKTDGSIDGYANASTRYKLTPCCVVYK